MSVEIAVERDIIRVTLSGVLTDQDLATIASAVDDIDCDRNPVPHRLTDLTAVTEMKTSYPDVRALADRRRALVFPNDFRSAIVVGTPVQRGMARMFQTLNDNPRITIRISTTGRPRWPGFASSLEGSRGHIRRRAPSWGCHAFPPNPNREMT